MTANPPDYIWGRAPWRGNLGLPYGSPSESEATMGL
jgi:hypothetical protein